MGDHDRSVPLAGSAHSMAAEEEASRQYHLSLLGSTHISDELQDAKLAPIFTASLMKHCKVSQFGLLAGVSQVLNHSDPLMNDEQQQDPRLFFNITPPSSTFICGSQGSGKSHTLSCMLESCLIPSKAGRLPNPLTAVVFHYDTFVSDQMGSPCEAAYLSSNPAVKVRVLCSPTNIQTMKKTYSRFSNVDIQPLEIDQGDLNTKRMLDLMAVDPQASAMPLYMHTIQRILRQMRISQQQSGAEFDYQEFKQRLWDCGLSPGQMEPLKQRLDTLESFMPQATAASTKKGRKHTQQNKGTNWEPKGSQLIIVDLSCPCISPETACSLFNVCLSIFLEQDPNIGRVVALDEAHKYMNSSSEAEAFTSSLLASIRLQRHLGVRVIISTQEPTISTALLNLCSTTIVHRFTSPEWLRALNKHLAAAAYDSLTYKRGLKEEDECDILGDDASPLFNQIVRLKVGEALLFSPTAIVDVQSCDDGSFRFRRLGDDYLTVRVRSRLTQDGGKSTLCL
ncbi:hypothetical protein ASPZODRAFT_159282 [Penicilliopsis zonata CBS 506.65]|uniref:Zona occludens toxin N-terminal domain-containing protein n=1 Tax=Penicilliopsis zonata CBS 506.65 TaxID=1073090 RepID=A0A1L9SJK2_9EURO|nr:hypothetical protein ASPZODRAFT_159282 [Penicilliopsis zonata CBS 506.65]OJJ47412.1 hypothetical protein ASPZODRAFT_159282 [Penicilliopsis zonata CBS 506.65]